MNRRQFLAVSGIGAATGGGAFLAVDNDNGTGSPEESETPPDSEHSSTVDGTAPVLVPGDDATVTVTANGIGLFQWVRPWTEEREANIREYFDFEFGVGEDVSPFPDDIGYADPPVWTWDEPTAVEATASITTTEDVSAGEYRYGVRLTGADNDSDETTVEFPITVVES